MNVFKIDIPGLKDDITPEDIAFLSRMKATILEQVSNPYFGVLELVEELGMVKSQLSRRLKKVTTYSPARMIKHFRMEYAMVLIIETRIPIKEVAQKIGIPELGNFSRAFKSHFHHTPSDLRITNIPPQRSFEFYCSIPMKETDLQYIQSLSRVQPWFKNLLKLILENIHNDKFGTVELAQAMNMSKSKLNRKIELLLKVTTAQFIKGIRLQYAGELLAYHHDKVVNIAYKAGFFDHPHFCRAFKSAFKCTPGNYRDNNERESVQQHIGYLLKLYKIDKRMN